MMTKQAELKKQAYASDLKSRALSILIYLIDRSNQDLTCFPAIPTMAEQLHISVSTVKRALHELVQAGFIKKDARHRKDNRGQTSNLYTLLLLEETMTPDNSTTPEYEAQAEETTQSVPAGEYAAKHITFAIIAAEQEPCTSAPQETAQETNAHDMVKAGSRPVCPPVHLAIFAGQKLPQLQTITKKCAGQFLSCTEVPFLWTGAEVNLQPP